MPPRPARRCTGRLGQVQRLGTSTVRRSVAVEPPPHERASHVGFARAQGAPVLRLAAPFSG